VEDFTAGAIHDQPVRRQWSVEPPFDKRVRELVRDWSAEKSPQLIEEMIVTALKIARDEMSVADLKLINRSVKEMRYAAKVFAPFQHVRKVVVFGSARILPDAPECKLAEEFARAMVAHDYMVITGGGEGIMGAAQRGAGREKSFGLNIRLPFEQRPNEIIDGDPKLINFNYFFTRKLNFVKETHAVVLFPGGFGTLDEGFEVLTLMQTGKARLMPLVMVDEPGGSYWKTWFSFVHEYLLRIGLVDEDDCELFKLTDNIDVAVAEILKFYKNFHSYRWVRNRMVIRLQKALAPEAVGALNAKFSDILLGGEIVQGSALPEEKNEPELAHMPRLILTPNKRNFGRIRRLIDAVNEAAIQ